MLKLEASKNSPRHSEEEKSDARLGLAIAIIFIVIGIIIAKGIYKVNPLISVIAAIILIVVAITIIFVFIKAYR